MLGLHVDNVGMGQARLLSQFFTNEDVARQQLVVLFKYLVKRGKDPLKMTYIEPSAGDGVFVRELVRLGVPAKQIRAVEVDPVLVKRHPGYILTDLEQGGFLSLTRKDLKIDKVTPANTVIVGNPPYSQPRHVGRSKIIAAEFMAHSMTLAHTVAFILGNTFRRPTTQAKLNHSFHLMHDADLPPYSYTLDAQPAKVTTIFQIWGYDAKTIRQDDITLGLAKRWEKLENSSWKYVKSTDPSANLRVCQWGSINTVGRMNNEKETHEIVTMNIKKHNDRVQQGLSLKNYDPDNSHFYICSRNPSKDLVILTKKRALFAHVAKDRAMGNNPCLTTSDIVGIYLSK